MGQRSLLMVLGVVLAGLLFLLTLWLGPPQTTPTPAPAPGTLTPASKPTPDSAVLNEPRTSVSGDLPLTPASNPTPESPTAHPIAAAPGSAGGYEAADPAPPTTP
ncbi:MAG: hypothetical protein IT443_13050, partial [Phycisphaeraceae bacterium]|nr:hypothetical protein [Phycisphaeraceae bacterium]